MTPGCPVESVQYLTLKEVAQLLRSSERTCRRLVKADITMPVLHLGRRLLFPRERLLAWLRSREQGPGRPRRTREPLLSAPKSAS